MVKKSVLILSLLALLSCLPHLGLNSVEVKASDGHPIHNLNTGLNYTSIQAAIDANETLDGHTIFVEKGIYYERVSADKELMLIGENRETTVIDGNGTGTVVQLGTNVTITNFTICNGEYGVKIWGGYGVVPVYSGNVVNNTRIMDNIYGAILMRTCANNTIINNVIVNNTLFGVHLWHAGDNTIVNNTLVNNGQGIDFYGNSNDNILRNNNMTNNTYNFGLILREETRNFLMGTPSKRGIVNDVDSSNTVNGKPIYYLVNRSNEQISSDAGYVWLNNCTNITINGCDLSNNLQGILLLFTNSTSIINNSITDNANGIYVGIYSSNNKLIGNTVEDNVNGIYLDDFSKSTTMRNNSISGSDMNFGLSPDMARYLSNWPGLVNDVDISNTVNGKPIIYWINQHNLEVPTNAGYVILINSTNILIDGLNLSNNVQNIFLLGSNDTIIANNSVAHSIYGIDVDKYGWANYSAGVYHSFYSFNTTVKGNIVLDNGVGIRMISDNSTILNNTLYRNPLGILADTSDGTISKNLIVASDLNTTNPGPDLIIFYYPELPWERSIELTQLEIGGIIVGGGHNVVYGNTVKDSARGLVMSDQIRAMWGSGNMVFYNNFINNTPYQAIGAPKASNNYDMGYPYGGNYWSNYNRTDFLSGPYQNETGSDGIGDSAFTVFPGLQYGVVDSYPLMAPISIFDAGTWNEVAQSIDVISNSTLSVFHFNPGEGAFLKFNVTGGKETKGFCRVTIPKDLLWVENGQWNVQVGDQQVNYTLLQDANYAYLYFTYEHSTKTVTIEGTNVVPELPSDLILPLFMIATLLAVIVYKRKQAYLH